MCACFCHSCAALISSVAQAENGLKGITLKVNQSNSYFINRFFHFGALKPAWPNNYFFNRFCFFDFFKPFPTLPPTLTTCMFSIASLEVRVGGPAVFFVTAIRQLFCSYLESLLRCGLPLLCICSFNKNGAREVGNWVGGGDWG